MRSLRGNFCLVLAVICLLMAAPLQRAKGEILNARREQLNQLLAQEWEYELRENPKVATIIGDYRYNDRWTDYSLAHVQKQRRDLKSWLARFTAFDTKGFSESERLNQSLTVRNLKQRIEGINLKNYEMPIDQFGGAHLQLAQFVALVPLDSTRHYEDYLARLHQVPRLLTDLIEVLQNGAKDGLVPPRFLLEKTVTQCQSLAQPAGEANVFGQPVAHFPDAVPAPACLRLREGILAAVDNEVRPAYATLAHYYRHGLRS